MSDTRLIVRYTGFPDGRDAAIERAIGSKPVGGGYCFGECGRDLEFAVASERAAWIARKTRQAVPGVSVELRENGGGRATTASPAGDLQGDGPNP